MGTRTIELRPEPATREAFAPYGVIPPFEGDGFPTADLVFTRNDGWVNFIGHTLDEIEVRDGRLRCELLNRHDTHTQTLMPMSGDALVVVAPPDVDFSEAVTFRDGEGVRVGATCVRTPASRDVALGSVSGRCERRAGVQYPSPRLADRQRCRGTRTRPRRDLRSGSLTARRHRHGFGPAALGPLRPRSVGRGARFLGPGAVFGMI